MLPCGEEEEEPPGGGNAGGGASSYEEEGKLGCEMGEEGGCTRYSVGVSIGGMGQTVTSLFRSRSQNLASLLIRGNSDHETIV